MATTFHPRIACFSFALGAAASSVLLGAGSASADPLPDPHDCDPTSGYCFHIPLEQAGPAPFVNPDGYWVGETNPHAPVPIVDAVPALPADVPDLAPPGHTAEGEQCWFNGQVFLYIGSGGYCGELH